MNLMDQLRELGHEILKQTEHDQLKAEIALISLESIRSLIVNNPKEEETQVQYQQFQQNYYQAGPNMGPMQYPQAPMGNFEEHFTTFSNDANSRAENIPFLHHSGIIGSLNF